MIPSSPLTRSQRAALFGGVSLIALQGLSACASKTTASPMVYTPPVDVPVASVPVDGYGAQGYRPVDGIATTLAVGEEDGTGPIPVEPDGGIGDGAGPIPDAVPAPYDPGFATTLAIGEEDGGTGPYTEIGPVGTDFGQGYAPPYDSGVATTLAVGEEDGTGPIPVEPDGGIGDGAGLPPVATTLALGEEDGGSYGQPTDPGFATTLAIGEEDGSGPIPVEPDGGIGDGAGPIPFAPTYAIGEDGGSYGQSLGADAMTTLAIGEEG